MQCCYCLQNIKAIYVLCAKCDVTLCPECFSCGVELGSHLKDHDYIIKGNDMFPIFVCGHGLSWPHQDEMQLLDVVEHLGYGNWKAISDKIPEKTQSAIMKHYEKFYVNGAIGAYSQLFFSSEPMALTDHIARSESRNEAQANWSSEDNDGQLEQYSETHKQLGYMPLRDDFELEYSYKAESSISDIRIVHNDSQIDEAVKAAQIDSYRLKVLERVRKKHTATDYQLVKHFAQQNLAPFSSSLLASLPASSKNSSHTSDRDLLTKTDATLMPFAQFMSAVEYQQLLLRIIHEEKLKRRIDELLSSLPASLLSTNDSGLEEETSGRAWRPSRRWAAKVSAAQHTLIKLFSALLQRAAASGSAATAAAGRGAASRGRPARPTWPLLSRSAPRAAALAPYSTDSSPCTSADRDDENGSDATDSPCAKKSRRFSARHLQNLPLDNCLTPRERILCTTLGLSHAAYITIKTCLLKDYLNYCNGREYNPSPLAGVERRIHERIVSFMKECGWIS